MKRTGTSKHLETTVTKKGQVTIPAEIRSRLGLKPHDKVIFEMEEGMAKLRPAPSKLLKGYGAVKPRQKPEDFGKLREDFEKGVALEVISET